MGNDDGVDVGCGVGKPGVYDGDEEGETEGSNDGVDEGSGVGLPTT